MEALTNNERTQTTLLELQKYLQNLVAGSKAQSVWVTAELSDVAERGGHCYLELIQKDPNTGAAVAKARAAIWANRWQRIKHEFYGATGQNFATGLKVMVCVSANYHPLYGMSLVISHVDPAYTMGDLERRRREILEKLKSEGVLDDNKNIEFEVPTLRIAVVSAPGAAGYGDFFNQLYNNGPRFRFRTRLFESVMQGEKAARSVIEALDRINDELDNWDCVVIIRGGGSTSDLSAFEDYDLAYNVAQFPLPVIVGIGHERDVTVLDFVAKCRVKTPTAAAELLIGMAAANLDEVNSLASDIVRSVSDYLAGANKQLAYAEGQLPVAPLNAIHRAEKQLTSGMLLLSNLRVNRIEPMKQALDRYAHLLKPALDLRLQKEQSRIDSTAQLLAAISPEATLKRGYSITRVNGRCVTDAATLPPGTELETTLHRGTIRSKVTD